MYSDVELLARIIEHTPIGIVILKPDRKIRYVNSLAAHLFNADREMLHGSSIDQFIVDRRNEAPWLDLWRRLTDGNMHEARVNVARRESEEITCAMTAFHLGGKEGQGDSVALVFRDVTHELKIAELAATGALA